MTVATNIDKELKEIGKKRDQQIEYIKEDARQKGIQLVQQFFQSLFAENEKLTHVYVTGYTPEWNDGEECVHDTRVYIFNDIKGWSEMGDLLECHLGWDLGDEENPNPEYAAINDGLSKSQCNDIEDQIPVHAMSEAFGTNWIVIATRDNVTIQEFEVGY